MERLFFGLQFEPFKRSNNDKLLSTQNTTSKTTEEYISVLFTKTQNKTASDSEVQYFLCAPEKKKKTHGKHGWINIEQ